MSLPLWMQYCFFKGWPQVKYFFLKTLYFARLLLIGTNTPNDDIFVAFKFWVNFFKFSPKIVNVVVTASLLPFEYYFLIGILWKLCMVTATSSGTSLIDWKSFKWFFACHDQTYYYYSLRTKSLILSYVYDSSVWFPSLVLPGLGWM